MEIKDTVFNMSRIWKRMPKDTKKLSVHYFANGGYGLLSKQELKQFKAIIDNDYRVVSDIIENQIKSK